MVFSAQTRAEVKEVDKHWKSNLIIRIFILAIDLMACLIFGLADYNISFLTTYIWIALVPSGIWTLIVIIFRLVRVKPVHPGVHVGCELTIFLATTVMQGFAYAFVLERAPWTHYYYYYFGDDNGGSFAGVFVGCLGLTCISVLHFYLFIRGCIETSRRRSHDIATQAAAMAAQIVKNMESRGTFYRRNSDASYELGLTSTNEGGSSNREGDGMGARPRGGGGSTQSNIILGLEDLHHDTGLAPMPFSSRMSGMSHGARSTRTGRTMFSDTRTQYSHTRSMSVPVPTSPMSLRTARTDEPSLFRLER